MESADYFQGLFDLVSPYLPTGWKTTVVYAEFGDASYSIEFYVACKPNAFIKCFDLPGIDEDELLDSLDDAANVLIKQRESQTTGEVWTNMTMTVQSTGDMKTDYDYTSPDELTFEHKQAWKERYL
ncbi:immunity protein YezG family protein [Collinsella sp. Sow4_D11]|uniref:immunity protein YezG family protein n=1 Tax=Collinsella sp. Sow4_D11 TaxID=3438775 RepID=UPI002FA47598